MANFQTNGEIVQRLDVKLSVLPISEKFIQCRFVQYPIMFVENLSTQNGRYVKDSLTECRIICKNQYVKSWIGSCKIFLTFNLHSRKLYSNIITSVYSIYVLPTLLCSIILHVGRTNYFNFLMRIRTPKFNLLFNYTGRQNIFFQTMRCKTEEMKSSEDLENLVVLDKKRP